MPAFSFLAGLFSKCVIITVNDDISIELACSILMLAREKIRVEICPTEELEFCHEWKANMCVAYDIDIMFDDDPNVVLACLNKGVKAINVKEFVFKYSDKLRRDN